MSSWRAKTVTAEGLGKIFEDLFQHWQVGFINKIVGEHVDMIKWVRLSHKERTNRNEEGE